MDAGQAIVLGIVEGLTEFLPVSSTGHLTIAEKLLGLKIDSDAVTAFTAVIQMGAIVAVLLFFRKDIISLLRVGLGGLRDPARRVGHDWTMACAVVVGSIPIGIIGFAAKDLISGPLRSLWVVGIALIGWSFVMTEAERRATFARHEEDVTLRHAWIMGFVQCVALIPGISRSGATISGGLFRGLDRVAATRLSFFLSIPALTGAGLYELKDAFGQGVGVGRVVIGTVVAFFVAYASIAWLLRFVAHHSIARFVRYRLALGTAVLIGCAIWGA